MDNKGRRILSILGTIILVCVAIYLRYQRYESRHRKQEQYQTQIQAVKEATQANQSSVNEQVRKAANAISEQVKTAEKLKDAEMNEDISQGYKIVKLNGKFLIVKNGDVDKATELTGVSEVYLVPTKDEDFNKEYKLLTVKKDGEWRVVDETDGGKDILVLTGETITNKTTFRVKDKTLYID